jgi:hypothetical protein
MKAYAIVITILFILSCFCIKRDTFCPPCAQLHDSIIVQKLDTSSHTEILIPKTPVHETKQTKKHLIDVLKKDSVITNNTPDDSVSNDWLLDFLNTSRIYNKKFGGKYFRGEASIYVTGKLDSLVLSWKDSIPAIYSHNYVLPPSNHFYAGLFASSYTATPVLAFESKKGFVAIAGYSLKKEPTIGLLFKLK